MRKNKFKLKAFLLKFQVRCIISAIVTLLGFVHPIFFIIGGLLTFLYALPMVIMACFMVIALEGMNNTDKFGSLAFLGLLAAIALPILLIMHGFSLL